MKHFKHILLSVAVLFMVGASFAQISQEEALSKFVSAGMAYKNEQYEEAAQKYNQIIEGGLESGAVYYNLGNSYYREGDIGRAILNYERAKRLIPRDSDLKFNERYVSSRVPRHENFKEENFFRGMIQSFVDFYTVDEMVMIIAGLVVIIGIVSLASLYGHWSQSLTRWVMILLAVATLLYSAGLMDKVQTSRDLAVVLERSDATFEPREDSTVHFKLSEGTKARILRTEGGWTKIERLDGKTGWIPSNVLEKI